MFAWFKKKDGPPDARAVMSRAMILKCLFVKAAGIPPPEYLAAWRKGWTEGDWAEFLKHQGTRSSNLIEWLQQSRLWSAVEEKERDFLRAPADEVTQQMLVDASWSVEAIVCLLWALGYIAELPPYDQQADPELTNKLPEEPAQVLLEKAALRPRSVVEQQRDFAELWHWRSRTRRLQESNHEFNFPKEMTIEKVIGLAAAQAASDGMIPSPIGDDFPAFGKPYRDLSVEEYSAATSIVMERHHALNWLCGFAPGNRWAETPTDT